jgi:hypothetical protein
VSAWVVIVLFAVGLPGLPALAARVGARWPDALPAARELPGIALVSAAVLIALAAAAGLLRYVRRRTEPLALARSLDAQHETSDLL